MGRAPKLTEVKLLEGNRGKRPLDVATEMTLTLAAPPMPRTLARDAREHWRYLCDLLRQAETLTPLDGPVLAVACQVHADIRKLERLLDKKGLIFQEMGSQGQRIEKRRPEVLALDAARKSYVSVLGQLGLTPINRCRVKRPVVRPPDDGVDEFFRGA